MLSAVHTLFFIIGFLVLFSIIMPLVAKFIKMSFTWTLVIIYLGILFGVIFDFSHLTNEVRMILAIGSILVSVAYILSHVSEKARARGEQLRLPEMHVKKGNTHMDIKFADAKKLSSAEDGDVDLNELSTIPFAEDNNTEFRQSVERAYEMSIEQENPYAQSYIQPVQQIQQNAYQQIQQNACQQSNRTLRPVSSVSGVVDSSDLTNPVNMNGDRRIRRETTGIHRQPSSGGFVSTRSGNWKQ